LGIVSAKIERNASWAIAAAGGERAVERVIGCQWAHLFRQPGNWGSQLRDFIFGIRAGVSICGAFRFDEYFDHF
jgi:hypothetical protein